MTVYGSCGACACDCHVVLFAVLFLFVLVCLCLFSFVVLRFEIWCVVGMMLFGLVAALCNFCIDIILIRFINNFSWCIF